MITTRPGVLERARDAVDPALRAAVARLSPELQAPAAYHLGWVDAAGDPVAGGAGKGVRGALALLSAEAVGVDAAVAVPAAVAIELVHNFSLVHDDVIDHDAERRHRPTVWAVFGVDAAVIAGDSLLTLAFQVLLDPLAPQGARAAAALANATQGMIAGQALDMAYERRPAVTVDECLAMEAGKTAALLGCAASLGAISAGAPDETVAALRRYGEHVGMAFQAVDDVLGIWGRPEATGKPVGSDLRANKKSLPISAALARSNGDGARLRSLLEAAATDERAVAEAADLIDSWHGRADAEALAHTHLQAALTAIDAVPLVPEAARELADLARFVVERDS